jgi:hypothetical protein
LEVRWFNIDPLPRGYSTVRITELKNSDGSVVRAAREEENHFPGRREFVVTLPLTDEAPPTPDEPPVAAPEQGATSPANQPATQIRPKDQGNPASPKPFDFRWLLLLAIPGLVWWLRSLRNRGNRGPGGKTRAAGG